MFSSGKRFTGKDEKLLHGEINLRLSSTEGDSVPGIYAYKPKKKKEQAEELTQTTSVSADFHVAPERCSTFRPGPE